MTELRAGRPEAAAAIWWLEERIEPTVSGGRVRLRGALQAAAGLAVGAAVFLYLSQTAGTIIGCIASVVGLAALVSPHGLFAAFERATAALGQVIGRSVTWLLMFLIFYGIFVPFHLLFRRGQRDAMRRFYEPDAETYWESRELGRSASGLRERQF
jgi:hypothetical protein